MSRRSVMRAWAEEKRNPVPLPPPPIDQRPPSSARLIRGQCPKCLVVYGRTMYGHIPHCTGKAEWPGIGPKPTAMIQNGQPVAAEILAARPVNAPADGFKTAQAGEVESLASPAPLPETKRPRGRPRKVVDGA